MRLLLRVLAVFFAGALLLAGWGYWNILADPVIRRASFELPGWPEGAGPLRVALIGDIHIQGPDMPPERVARLVEQVNAQHPDLILLAGDFVGDRKLATRYYSDAEIAAPLAGLSAPLGTFAVLGNHDHWRKHESMEDALRAMGIPVLDNHAVRVGVLTLVGGGDAYTRKANPAAMDRAASALPGPVLAFAHSPDVAPELSSRFTLLLSAHTHCGQIVIPFRGSLASSSRFGDRYRCGVIREGARTVVVTSGWGASVVPLRYGAPPDWWLVTVGGKGVSVR